MTRTLLTNSIAVLLASLTASRAQIPSGAIRNAGSNGLQINVSGALGNPYSLQTSTNLVNWELLSEGIAPEQLSLSSLDPAWANRPAAFFRISTNYDADSIEGVAYLLPPAYYIFLSNAPTALVSGQAFDLGVCVADAAGNVLQISGYAVFSLVDSDGRPVTFSYSFTPAGISIVNGSGRVRITLVTSGDVTGAQIRLDPDPSAGPHPMDDSPTLGNLLSNPAAAEVKIAASVYAVLVDSTITPTNRPAALYNKLLQLRTNYTSAPSAWTYPLPVVAAPTDGFGSHRGSHVSRLHTGADLAAPYRMKVLAAKNGMIVSWHYLGPASSPVGGYQILVDHGSNTWTRYLHVNLNTNKHLYDQVLAGEAFASIATSNGSHLHFELCQDASASDAAVAANPTKYFGAISNPPTKLVNSADLRFSAGITDRLFPAASNSPPAITNLIITGLQPWSQAVPTTKTAPAEPSPINVYVLAQIVDWKGNYTIPPRGITFSAESNAPVSLVFDKYYPADTNTAAHYLPALRQAADQTGLALYSSSASATSKVNYYRYWFTWNTPPYSSSNSGPHSFSVTATNNFGVTASRQFTFGPQILKIFPDAAICGRYIFTNVAYLGTNNPVGLSQPDRYKLQIVQTNGVPLSGVQWDDPVTNYFNYGITPALTNHLQRDTFAFTLPAGTSASGLRLRVTSILITNIACDASIPVYSGTYTGAYAGIPINLAVYPGGAVEVETTSVTGYPITMFGEVNETNGSISATGCYGEIQGGNQVLINVVANGQVQTNSGPPKFSGSFSDGQSSGNWSVTRAAESQFSCPDPALIGTYTGTSPAGGSGSFVVHQSGYVDGSGGGAPFLGLVNLATGELLVRGCFYDTDDLGQPFVNIAVGSGTLVTNSAGGVTASGSYSSANDAGSWSATKQ